MIKKLRLVMTLVVAVLGLQSVQAQFTKADLTADGWTEITELPTPLEDYFFVFADATQEFMLAAAPGANQGNWTKALYYQEAVNPTSDLSKVWTLEPNPNGEGNGCSMRNVEHRTYLFHTWWESWNFKAENKPFISTNRDETRMYIAYDAEHKWTIKSNGGNQYVGPWSNAFVVGAEMAGNKGEDITGENVCHFQLYSMPRKTFAEKYIGDNVTADLSFMTINVINQEKDNRYSWSADFTDFDENLDNEFAPRWNGDHNIADYSNDFFYQAWNGNTLDNFFSGTMSCELKNLPAGTYALTAYGFKRADDKVKFVVGNTAIDMTSPNGSEKYEKLAVNDITVGDDGKLTMKYEIEQATWVGLTGFTLMYGSATEVAKGEYQTALAKANETVAKEMSEYAKGILQGVIDANGNLSDGATVAEFNAAAETLNAAVAAAEKAVKSYAVIKNGVIATDNVDGWSSTVGAAEFRINTWSNEGASDGSGMTTPFLQNWIGSGNTLGDGVITYTLEGIENGYYSVSALLRAFSEDGNEIGGTCNFALNNGAATDLISSGTATGRIVYATCEATEKVENNTLTLSITVTGATYNWLAIKDVKIVCLGTTTPEEGNYQLALAKANETLAKDMSQVAKNALQVVIDASDDLTSEATADEFIAATEALNAAVVTAEKAVKSYEIIKNGIIPTDNLDGWASTVPAEKFHVNTWSGNADDGSNINAPFVENWIYKDNGVLGDGTITYTLEGIENGWYTVSALMRAFSESGNAVEGTCNFALNDGEPVDMIATGTESLFGNSRIYGTCERTVKVEDNKLTLSITITGATYNWLAIDDVKIAAVENVTADPADGSTVKSDLKSIAITFPEATTVAVNADNFEPVAILDANGEYAGTIGRMGSPFTAEGNVATLKNLAMGNEMALFPGAGVYTLEIPAGAFLIGEDATPSKKIQLTYTVEEVAPVVANFTATPESGTSVETLEKVTLTFTDYEDVGWNYEFCTENIVIKKDGEVYKEGNNDTGLTAQPGAYNEFDIVAGLTEVGTYEIIVPDGYFKDNMDMSFPNKGFAGFTLTYTVTGAPAGTKTEMVVEVERIVNLGYAVDVVNVDLAKVCETLGIASITEATVWGVNATGEYIDLAQVLGGGTMDGWRNLEGVFTNWNENSYVCYKYVSDGNFTLQTHPSYEPAVGAVVNAYWGFTAAADTVVVKTVITFVASPVVTPADFEIVETIDISVNYNVATGDEVAVAIDDAAILAAAGVDAITDANVWGLNADGTLLMANTANSGCWYDATGTPINWGAEGFAFYVELRGNNTVTVGNQAMEADKEYKVVLYVANADAKKLVQINVTISTATPVGINGIAAEDIVKTEYFGMNGAALNAPVKGINIVKYTLVDGKVVTAKVYVK